MAPPQGQLRVSRYFAVLAVLVVALYALVFFTGPDGSWKEKLTPRLGLDLQGGTTVTLHATTPNGKAPPADQLEQARQIMENRVNGTGVAEAEVLTEGNSNIVINVPGQDAEGVKRIGQPAKLKFRQVTMSLPADTPAPEASPSPSVTPSGTASPKPSTSASPTPAAKASAAKSPGTGGFAPGQDAPGSGGFAPTPSPSVSGSASPKPSASASPSPNASQAAQQAVLKKFNPAALQVVQQAAQQVAQSGGTDPSVGQQITQALASEQYKSLFAPVDKLTPEEIAALPTDFQLIVPAVTCDKLNGRPAGSIDASKATVVACEGTATKYLLQEAKVEGTDVRTADFTFDPAQGWKVIIKFKGDGQKRWTDLTKATLQKQVAVVLDNEVVSAPTIQSVITGDAEVTGQFSKSEANQLASKLKYGSLPLSFRVDQATTISPTLGIEQLEAGLLAGGIGLALVVVYSLLYYRALGLVTIASLVVSAGIILASVILLGRQIGFTLTLAGVAGFIVAVGITADSFVVFFERLKDEVKEGRSVRSAVPRAWVRARRTILSADAVSALAAIVLYILSVGAVKGFAFTLGLSTLVDVIIVFLFTHPLVALLSRSKSFTSPRFSGLGRVKAASAPAETRRRSSRVTPKES